MTIAPGAALRPAHAAAVLAAVALLLGLLPAPASAGVNDLDAEETEAIRLLNQERISRGLGALTLSPVLTASAEWMSADLAKQGALSHVDSLGRELGPRVHSFGYPTDAWIRENIAMGYVTGADVMAGWMGSPGHRANNLAAEVTAAGIARVRSGDGTWYWTLVMGSHRDPGNIEAPGGSATPTPAPSGTPPVGTGPGTFASGFPDAGFGLNIWNGGSVAQLTAGAAQGGARSVFVTVEGRLVGYVLGAPSFVNAAFVEAFPGGTVPAGTGVLIVV